jgi:hypothetical protein
MAEHRQPKASRRFIAVVATLLLLAGVGVSTVVTGPSGAGAATVTPAECKAEGLVYLYPSCLPAYRLTCAGTFSPRLPTSLSIANLAKESVTVKLTNTGAYTLDSIPIEYSFFEYDATPGPAKVFTYKIVTYKNFVRGETVTFNFDGLTQPWKSSSMMGAGWDSTVATTSVTAPRPSLFMCPKTDASDDAVTNPNFKR